MEANNWFINKTHFLHQSFLINAIFPKNAGEKKRKTKQNNIDGVNEKKGEKPTTMQLKFSTFSDYLLETWKQQRSIVFYWITKISMLLSEW